MEVRTGTEKPGTGQGGEILEVGVPEMLGG